MTTNQNADASAPMLENLYAMIDETWDANHDWTIVPRLAAEYPALADRLYDYLEILVEAEVEAVFGALPSDTDVGVPRPLDIFQWYQNIGRAVAAQAEQEVYRQSRMTRTESPTDVRIEKSQTETIPHVGSEDAEVLRPLLGYLRLESGRAAPDVAHDLEVNFALLTLVSRHPDAVPESWRVEIRQRITRAYGSSVARRAPIGIPHAQRDGYRMAALRDIPYSQEVVTWEMMLIRAKLHKEEEDFWRRLAIQ